MEIKGKSYIGDMSYVERYMFPGSIIGYFCCHTIDYMVF